MTPLTIKSTVGTDGVLHLDIPLGASEANQEVEVIVRPTRPPLTPEEWREFIARTAGSWRGELERPDQGSYEQREELP